jgi:hypothetical protein
VSAGRLLPDAREIQLALGPTAFIEPRDVDGPASAQGEMIRAAAEDSAFGRFTGQVEREGQLAPLVISALALIFGSREWAETTFTHVAQAAHLKTTVEGCDVAVETVTSVSGLVSYWGYVHRGETIVILTLDTSDPQRVSIADLRSLVGIVAERLQVPT